MHLNFLHSFVRYLHLVYQNILLGRIDDQLFRILKEGDRRFRERFAIMVDELPLNSYVRAYRGTPMYGLKRPNHTLWIRERIGLDQFATTDAVEFGTTPNVPFFRASYMLGDPYVSEEQRQKGFSIHTGLRGVTAGWHLNSSLWRTQSATQSIQMQAFGGGFHSHGVLGYAERNWRSVHSQREADGVNPLPAARPGSHGLHPSSTMDEYTLAFTGVRGLMLGTTYERMQMANTNSKRTNLFVDIHPIPFVHVELWRRFEHGARPLADTLAILHLFADL